ncbi:MAG: DUF4943 family protein [Planctomycetes bacterium]|nr:DUF4943 family protein [Planctomycetota bacterium]
MRSASMLPILVLLVLLPGCGGKPELVKHSRTETPEAGSEAEITVARLFAAMKAGEYARRSFPELGWEDLRALLDRAASRETLTDFPRNPISSQYQVECSEGMVALWLMEGIRQGGHFASLNALCFRDAMADGQDWGAASEANHEALLAAYSAWWEKARVRSVAEAAMIDPLAGTGLHWY